LLVDAHPLFAVVVFQGAHLLATVKAVMVTFQGDLF
jgi:hypothetical protein